MTQTQKLIALAGLCVALVLKLNASSLPLISDPLTGTVVAAYQTEADTNKAAKVSELARVYANGQKHAQNPSVSKASELYLELKADANAVLSPDDLPVVRAEIAKELNSKLPTKASDTFDRVEAVKQFKRVQTALEACK